MSSSQTDHHHHRDRVSGCPSYVAGQHGVPRLIGTAAVTHRMEKWQGRWLHGVASGSIPPFLARWKGKDREPSLSVHWSRASPPLATVRAKGQLRPTDGSCIRILWSDSFSHPGIESLSLWSALPPTSGGHMRMPIPLRIAPSPMSWCTLLSDIFFFLGLVSTTFSIIFAFTDITISCQIKTAFHLIFSSRNCLINEQGLICTDDHRATQLHQIAHPEMVHHIVLITEWQLLPGVVYINAARLWKGIIVVLNAVEADRIHFLTCQGQQQKSGSCRGLSTQRKMNLFAQTCMHTRGHMDTHIARQNQPHST